MRRRGATRSSQASFANVEAARFFRRALDSAARVPTADRREVAAAWEALGDVSERTGLYRDAADAYARARRLSDHDVARLQLMLKEGVIRERTGRYSQALRWYGRGLRSLAAVPHPERRLVDHDVALEFLLAYAGVRVRQGRFAESIEWCERAVELAREIDDREALAHAYYLLHLAYSSLNRPEVAEYRGLAIPIYEEIGDMVGLAKALNNLGNDEYFQGAWDKAVSHWEWARQLNERTGDIVGVATITNNIGEILSDQGKVEEATASFEAALRITEGAGYRFVATLARSNLGRLAARTGRFGEAGALLADALEGFSAIRAQAYVSETRARLAECAVLQGDGAAAIAAADASLADPQVPVIEALLRRVRAYALAQTRRMTDAVAEAERSLAIARSVHARFEIGLGLEALGRITPDIAAEASALVEFEQLGILRTPVVPLPGAASEAVAIG
jgi:tetratricopeptide (TPR) repeat protein